MENNIYVQLPSDEEIENASKDCNIETKGIVIPIELAEMHLEILRTGFIIGAKWMRSQAKAIDLEEELVKCFKWIDKNYDEVLAMKSTEEQVKEYLKQRK